MTAAALRNATILAIDLGTQSLRVTALAGDGARVWSWASPVTSQIEGERFEQSPAEWRDLLETALTEARRSGIRPDAVAIAAPLAGYVALDAEGTPLTKAAMYTDSRPLPDVARVEAAFGTDAIYRPVVSDPWPHWLRLCREQPEIAARTRHFLDATGWFNFHLSGLATLNAYTALRLGPPDATGRLALGPQEMPRFGRTTAIGEVIGPLLPRVARHFDGHPAQLVAATFDSKCAYIGSGIAEPGEALDISGTVTSFGVVSDRRIDDPQRRVYSVPFGQRWLVRGSTAAAGSSLEWARANLIEADFALLDAAVASVPPGADGLSFLPYLAGERTPWWKPRARGALLGLALDSSQAAIARAVYEGLAVSLAHLLRPIEDRGARPREIRLAGGLARNDLLAQIKADVLGVPLARLADHELTTQGLAAIAGVGIGLYPDHAAAGRQVLRIERRFVPDPAVAAAYGAAEQRYRRFAEALLPTFD